MSLQNSSSKTRVLIIVQNLPVPFDRRVWLEAQTLTEAGYGVTVISPKGKDDSKYELLKGVHIYRYRAPTDAEGMLGYVFEFIYCWCITFYLSLVVLFRHGFHLIHACNPPETYFLLGLFYKFFGKKFIFDHHDLSPEMYVAKFPAKKGRLVHRVLLLLERLTFKTADVVITTNLSHREIAIKRGGVKPEKIFVVRSGPDFERLQLKPSKSELRNGKKYLVCYLGEMCPQDGVDYLIESVNYLVKDLYYEEAMFTFIGGGPALPMLKEKADDMGLNNIIKFTGRVSDEVLCEYLSTADVCVDPDPYTDWSDKSTMNKIMEYMAFKKPIVAFDLKENRFSAAEAALYTKPNDSREFAENIVYLLENEPKRREMGSFGFERVRSELLWDYSKPNLIKAYHFVSNSKEAV
jgi:glycosyltransferase involved in cell wall biosynthesis